MNMEHVSCAGKRPTILYSSAFSQRFWNRLAEGELETTRCGVCKTKSFPPRQTCSACGAAKAEWVAVATSGVVYSRTRIHAALPQFGAPLDVAIIDLDDDIRLVCSLLDYEACPIAARVELVVLVYEDGPLFAARAAQ
jgi:uncharacterized OB-fold protein